MLINLGMSILYSMSPFINIQSGNYTCILVVMQLFAGSTITYLLGEVLHYYGICSIFTLFMASNACQTIFWQAFSPVTKDLGRGPEFEGSVLSFIHLLFSWENKSHAIYESLFRKSQPNLFTLGTTIFIFILFIHLQSILST